MQAARASDFIDSIGVDTHFSYPSYRRDKRGRLEELLIASGIRHIRDGNIWSLAMFKSLAAQGIRTTWNADPALGVVPNRDYWCNPNGGPHNCYLLGDYLKTVVGPGVFDTIESINEPDGFFGHYKWRATAPVALNNRKSDPNYWENYATALTRDVCAVIHDDPALKYLKCIGPALGGTSERFSPGTFYGVVDYANMHPYPGLGNGATPVLKYDTINAYYHWGDNPSLNMDEHPRVFQTYSPAFTGPNGQIRPFVVTETGYCTGTAKASVTLVTHAKYIPRLFAEYFRHGIVRTFSYELLDEWDKPSDCESNFGLITYELNPKPAYTALSNLITLLREPTTPAPTFLPGTLSYAISARSVASYNRLQYVHDLLLQKKTGEFYLLIWHEISDAATSNGTPYRGTAMDIDPPPPALPVSITLASEITSATLYTYGNDWKLQPESLKILKNQISLEARDTISVIRLSK